MSATAWRQNGNEVLLTAPDSTTEITGLRNSRYNFIFNLIIANPGATVSINATINSRTPANNYAYKTINNSDRDSISDKSNENNATLTFGTTTPGFLMCLLYSETDNPKAGISYQVSSGGTDQTTAPGHTVTYWKTIQTAVMTQLNFDNSNPGAYGAGFNTVMISAN